MGRLRYVPSGSEREQGLRLIPNRLASGGRAARSSPTNKPLREHRTPTTTTMTRSGKTSENINDSIALHTLCGTCRSAVSRSAALLGHRALELLDHYRNPADLVNSASDGCHLCSLLLSTVRVEKRGSINDSGWSIRLRVSCRSNPQIRRIGLEKWQYGQAQITPPSLVVTSLKNSATSLDPVHASQDYKVRRHICTASDAAFDLATDWIRLCTSDHHICNQIRSYKQAFPTRLLDLRTEKGETIMCLRQTRDILNERNTACVEYTALSHCWGTSPTMKLLQDPEGIVKDLRSGMPSHLAPATFHQAAMITTRLGYRYLWIDLLCIIQDSESDWIAESSIMGDIYAGSVCTIAALAAEDSHGGCFQTRNPLMSTSCHLSTTMKVGSRCAWEPYPLTGKLLERGWAFQERILAPRTLFYGTSGITWECNQSQMTEDGVTSFGRTPKSDFRTLMQPLHIDYGIGEPTEALSLFHTAWAELITVYTSTKLTRQSDKLVAIHGLVRKIAELHHLTPVAGLWQEVLLVGLLWCTEKPQTNRNDLYIAPSWSWASIDAPVTNRWAELTTPQHRSQNRCRVEWKVKVLDVLVTSNPNGQVFSAALKIQGPLRRLPLDEEQMHGGLMCQEREWTAIRGEDRRLIKPAYGFHDGTITRSKVFPDCRTERLSSPLYVLWLARSFGTCIRVRDGVVEPRMIDAGLVLERLEGHKSGFRRRGYFEQHFYDNARSYLFSADQEFVLSSLTII